MRSFTLAGRRQLTWTPDAPVPKPGRDQVLVRVGACTICNRSDLVYFHYLGMREHCGQGCFGHEVAGVVEVVGDTVTTAAPGDRVFLRAPLTTGFAEFALARQLAVGQLPDHVPFDQGAMLQLLPLAVHATRGVRLGDRVAILGQGPVGLMTLQVAARRGASELVVADLDPWRLAHSRALGADQTVQVPRDGPGAWELVGSDFDVAIDAVGIPATANGCVTLVRTNGLAVFLGTHHVDTQVTFDLISWEKKGLRIHTGAEPTDEARAAAMRVAQRLAPDIELARLLTAAYPLEDLPAAIDRLSASSILDPAGRPGVHPGPPPRTLKIAIVP
jgi:L-iditol 2-dehydrogenase